MNCQQASLFLSAYLDRELSVRETLDFEQHLHDCASCQSEYEQQLQLHARIKAEATYFDMPDPLAAQIAASFPALQGHDVKRHQWRHWWDHWFGLSAVLVACVAVVGSLVLYLSMPTAEETLTQEIIASHVRSLMVDHLSDIASSDQHTVKPWFNGKIDFSPPVIDLAAEDFPLVGGRLDYLNGRTVAALIYRHRLHPINLYVFPAQHGNQATRMLVRQGYDLFHWSSGNMEYWVISDLALGDLNVFVQKIQSQINAALVKQ